MITRYIIVGLGQNVYKNGRSFKSLAYTKKKLELCELYIVDPLEIKEIEVPTIDDLQKEIKRLNSIIDCSYVHSVSIGICNKCSWVK
jgi:hypothetical protein